MLIQQWSKRASHFFKDLGYKTQEIASVENEILVKTIDTVKVPSFKFLNMSDSISNNELLGNNYLIQFFTACPTICPASTTNIRNEIHKKFKDVDDLKIISISIAEDPIDRMLDYAKKFKIDSPNWLFLTGERDKVWSFANELTLSAGIGSEEEGGFFHSPFLVLADKKVLSEQALIQKHKPVWDATSISDTKLLSEDISQLFLIKINLIRNDQKTCSIIFSHLI